MVRVSDRKSTRLNSSHLVISYAVFCLKKKEQKTRTYAVPGARGAAGRAGLLRGAPQLAMGGSRCPAGGPVSPEVQACVFFFFLRPGPPRISPLLPNPPLSG